jgi:adenine C2-methylase RlmN of 23S rRNA A2503 and tRNA A37
MVLEPPSQAAARVFQKTLIGAGVRCYMRRETGSDISAACGQLAGSDGGL